MGYNIIGSLLASLSYNRTEEYMVTLTEELLGRIKHTFPCYEWSDMGDIIYGYIVMIWGDYGTSPRSGWIESEHKGSIIKELEEELKEYKRVIEYRKEGGH